MADANAAATIINGQDGNGKVTIAGVNHAFQIAMFRLRVAVEMLVGDTFANEGEADQEPGREQLSGEMMGLLKKGTVNAGPLLPPPQNVAMVFQYSENCTISGNFNFTECTADRLVNQNATLSGRVLSKRGYVVAWDDGT